MKRLIATSIVLATAALATIAFGQARTSNAPRGTVQLAVASGSGSGTDSENINIIPAIVDMQGAMVGVSIEHSGPNAPYRMIALDINGDTANAFTFVASGCTAHQCVFNPGRVLPDYIDIACTPDDAITRGATLVAQGEGANNFDMATLRCIATGSGGGGPILQVSPAPVNAGTVPVGQTGSATAMFLTNNGSGTLSAQLAFASSEWTASACVTAPCMFTGQGSGTVVDISFTPSTHGSRDSNLAITNNGPTTPYNVALTGFGDGARLDVIDPPAPFEIDFGTIPKNQIAERPLSMLAMGTRTLSIDLAAATAPFSIVAPQFALAPGVAGGTMVRCSSAAAGGPFSQTIAFTSGAYDQNTSSVSARCTVADTDLEVTPAAFDFGEVRVGSDAAELPFTLRNPSPTPIIIRTMRLSSSAAGLSLQSAISSDVTLAPGETRSGTLVLDPETEVDLAGRTLDITVDASALHLPITGKVVRAHARVVPAELDLGTVCITSTVTGQIQLVNDGTATLTVQRPSVPMPIDLAGDPAAYPARLLGGLTAAADVSIAQATAGVVEGAITWAVDAPDAPFEVPVEVEFISEGAAISPGRVAFGTVPVETRSERRTVKLENCGTSPITLELGGVTARVGGTTVWDVQPNRGTIILGVGEIQAIGVQFAPQRRGSYAAQIELEVDDARHDIEIFGDASGPILEKSSFYACACSGPSAPSRGWPIVLAIAALFRRRSRSGSSSAR